MSDKICATCKHGEHRTFLTDYGSEHDIGCKFKKSRLIDGKCKLWRDKQNDQSLKADAVNRPSHYAQGGVECIDAIKAATTGLSGFEGYCTGNAIKYLWRWKRKNGVQDLEKARWYLDRLILEEKLEAGE